MCLYYLHSSNNYHDLVTNHVFSPLFRYTLFLWEHSVEVSHSQVLICTK